MSAVDKLKLAEEKNKAANEGMTGTNANITVAILSLHNKQVKDSSKDEKPILSGSKAWSSFLALPTGLHIQTVLNLADSINPGPLNKILTSTDTSDE
ncbi:hypothetical protein HO173_001797 [Letharia columbiana]|uniref:Uncharacterized protein n=1 Tax=Letharia columbiana TaxID=112416 RepID=A0A8H6G4B4_9LECA|nr:uncharacterized protein HO173_001797 [Letharia columbiana]KAF6240187.1 hypothetical protein HO173_001797 [Letharia columbiana]